MYCPNCGQQLADDVKFCWKCGLDIKNTVKRLPSHTHDQQSTTTSPESNVQTGSDSARSRAVKSSERMPTCPHCGQLDSVQKISSIVASGISTVNYETKEPIQVGEKTVWMPKERQATTYTEMAKRLAPPQRPNSAPGCTGAILDRVVFGLLGSIGIVFCPMAVIGVLSGGQVGNLWITLPIAIVIAIGLVVWFIVRQTAMQPAIQRWEYAVSKWQQLFYCARCDGIFIPELDKFVPTERMTSFLYE